MKELEILEMIERKIMDEALKVRKKDRKSFIKICMNIQKLKEEYFNELKKLVENTINLRIPLTESREGISFLERFSEVNKIVDTKKLWNKKYKRKYEKLMNELFEFFR